MKADKIPVREVKRKRNVRRMNGKSFVYDDAMWFVKCPMVKKEINSDKCVGCSHCLISTDEYTKCLYRHDKEQEGKEYVHPLPAYEKPKTLNN